MVLRLEGVDEFCVSCMLNTVVHGGIVCAVRQASLASLQRIIDDPVQFSSLDSATISRIHSRLLASLLSVSPPPPAPFASQLIPFICNLSVIADTTFHPQASTTTTSFVAAAVNASVFAIQNRACSIAAPFLAAIISSVSSPGPLSSSSPSASTPAAVIDVTASESSLQRYLRAALGRNALSFVRMLLKTPPDATTWLTTASVLIATIKASSLTLSADKVIPLVPVPPTLRVHTSSTSAYLSVIAAIIDVHSSTAAKGLLIVLDDFVSVLRHALLSANSDLSALAANIVTTLVRLSSPVTNALVQNNVTEYLIETLRTAHHPSISNSDCFFPALPALAALSAQCPDALVPKWPYALSIVMTCASVIALDLIPSFLTVLHSAFKTAAVSVFSPTVAQQMVALIFRLFNQTCPASPTDVPVDDRSHVDRAIDCLLLLISRYRISSDVIHSVLSVSELCSTNTTLISSGLRLIHACASQFCTHVEKQKDQNVFNDEEGNRLRRQQEAALVSVGKRLVFILLDTFGPLLNSTIDTVESAASFLGGLGGIISLMRSFTTMMRPEFVSTGCISATEQYDARVAFWNMLPIRIVLAVVEKELDSDGDMRAYIDALLSDMDHYGDGDLTSPKTRATRMNESYPRSPEHFVKMLSEDVRPMEMATTFQMLQIGLIFRNVQALGETGAIVDALGKRIENILLIGDNITVDLFRHWQDHLVRTMISISTLCQTSNMVFPANCLTEDAARVFLSRCKDLSQETTFNIACEILCLKHLEAFHSIIWDKMAHFLSYSYTIQTDERKSSLYTMCESNEVVLNSILNAVLRVTVPQRIAALVSCLYLHGKDHVPHLKVGSKRDAIQMTVQQLTNVHAAWKKDNSPVLSKKVSCTNDLGMECLRASALLEIVVSTDAISDTVASWSLLRILTELFISIGTLLSLNQPIATLHASMLHCAVQMMKKSQDSKRLVYMVETGGILEHCINALKAVPNANIGVWELQKNEHILLHIGCFLLVMLQNENTSVREVTESLILGELTSNSEIWECALADHLERHEFMTGLRIANLTFLLHKICILTKKLSKLSRTTQFVSSHVLTLVCVSCASPRIFVSDVNHLLLSTIMQLDGKMANLIPHDVLYMLSEITMSKLCYLTRQLVLANELICSKQLVLFGTADKYLPKLHDSLYDTWKEWNGSSSKLNSTAAGSEKKTFPSSSLAQLLLAVQDRISTVYPKQNLSTKLKIISQRDHKRIQQDSKGIDEKEAYTVLQGSQLCRIHHPHSLRTGPS